MDTRMKLALYPGTFDPLTNGHLALIRRGLAVFDQIVCNNAYADIFQTDFG